MPKVLEMGSKDPRSLKASTLLTELSPQLLLPTFVLRKGNHLIIFTLLTLYPSERGRTVAFFPPVPVLGYYLFLKILPISCVPKGYTMRKLVHKHMLYLDKCKRVSHMIYQYKLVCSHKSNT